MNETTDAPSIFAPLWRRKWLILAVAVLVAAGTYVYYKRKPHVYSASTQLFLGNGAEEQIPGNTSVTSGGKKSGTLDSSTQAAIINSSLIREPVKHHLKEARKTPATRAALHGKATAKAKEKGAFITISTQARNAPGAALLANTTAQVYIARQSANYQRSVETAIALAKRQLRRIEAAQELAAAVPAPTKAKAHGKSGSTSTTSTGSSKSAVSTAVTLQEANLRSKINQYESELSVTGVKQVDPAKAGRAELIAPKPRTNAIFGFAIGLVLASFAAYALSRLDRRLRSLSQIESTFRVPILTGLPAVRRPVVEQDGQRRPANALREPTRRLHMGLKVGGREVPAPGVPENGTQVLPRVLLFVSADPGDGKSTLVADLAYIQRDAGEHVAVIEADFRRPVQASLLGVAGSHGLADVLEGRLSLESAMQWVEASSAVAGQTAEGEHDPTLGAGGVGTLVESASAGSLSVLLGSTSVPNPPALLAQPMMQNLVRSLAQDFDYVLIDAPGPLQFSDALPLLRAVDGIVIVARLGHTGEAAARRLAQMLEQTPSAPVLGVVANAVPSSEIKKYGFSSARQSSRWSGKLIGR